MDRLHRPGAPGRRCVVIVLVRTVRIVPQQTALIVERLGRYSTHARAGHATSSSRSSTRSRANVDLREQVVTFPPQPVITSDNLVVSIDTVIYYRSPTPKAAVYEIANFIQGIEQLTVTTLRNVIGSLDLEQTLTSRDQINAPAARRPRRGDRQLGHPRQPGRAQGHRPAALDPGLDGEADAGRA